MEKEMTSKAAVVMMHHLTALIAGQLEDLMSDYTDESVLMSPEQTFHGLSEIRGFYQASIENAPAGFLPALTAIHQDFHDEIAYLVWKAEPFVKMGTDTFVIRNGKIIAQTFLMTA